MNAVYAHIIEHIENMTILTVLLNVPRKRNNRK